MVLPVSLAAADVNEVKHPQIMLVELGMNCRRLNSIRTREPIPHVYPHTLLMNLERQKW